MKKITLLSLLLLLLTISMVSCSKKETAEKSVDVVTTASIVNNGDALIKAVSKDGAWLAATLNDIVLKQEIVIDGEFTAKEKIDRKLALYTQDADHKITAQFTLTAPKMIVKSPNFRITGGTFKGDVYVEAAGFKLDKSSTVEGDIYFATQAQLDSFTMDETAVFKGKKSVLSADVLTTASIVTDGEALAKALSANGAWLAATLNDVTYDKDMVVDGEFTWKEKIDRKLALYTQDDAHKITDQFTLTAPKLIVKSPNFRITGGTFKGDVYVEATGFKLDKSSTVDGNIYFSTQEQMDSFTMDATATFKGTKSVK
ncbi:MAG: polymer-forming cytoskeletal protein [Spirochaetales bacterium]|nr:polymer-forming cytoskeletal protein [Spirochaetales bacterium]